jgi:hypothetical protein
MVPVTDPELSPPSQGHPLPEPLHAFNEGLAFLLELLMLAALAWWGYQAVGALAARIVLMVAAPALAIVIWGLFAAPRARIKLPVAGVLAVKTVIFGTAAAAVYSRGQHGLAIAFAVVAAVNMIAAAIDRAARRPLN